MSDHQFKLPIGYEIREKVAERETTARRSRRCRVCLGARWIMTGPGCEALCTRCNGTGKELA